MHRFKQERSCICAIPTHVLYSPSMVLQFPHIVLSLLLHHFLVTSFSYHMFRSYVGRTCCISGQSLLVGKHCSKQMHTDILFVVLHTFPCVSKEAVLVFDSSESIGKILTFQCVRVALSNRLSCCGYCLLYQCLGSGSKCARK